MIRKHTYEVASMDFPRRLVSLPGTPLEIRKGRPGFLGPSPLRSRHKYLRSECSRRQRYESLRPIFCSAITLKELHKFFGILLYSTKYQVQSLKEFWSKKPGAASFPEVQLAMSYERFALIYRCFRFSEEEVSVVLSYQLYLPFKQMIILEQDINRHMQEAWRPANIAVVDETLVPHKGRKNPHHVFIIRKPHPHGLKNWSVVDFSGYFFGFSLFRRDRTREKLTYEAADQTLLRMSNILPPGTLIVADSYFGSLKALEGLAQQGKYGLFSMNSTCDTMIFHDDLHQRVRNDGESASLFGVLPGPDGEEVPFIANTFQSEGRRLNTLLTCFSDLLSEKELEILVDDGSEEEQQEIKKLTEMRPMVRIEYSKIMDCVDKADQATMANLSPNRKKNWTTAEKFWEVTMLLTVNAKKLYESANSTIIERGKEWKDMLIECLLDRKSVPGKIHPCSMPKKKIGLANCRACCVLQKKRVRTTWRCQVCGPICKSCERNDRGRLHKAYWTLPTSSRAIRRSYVPSTRREHENNVEHD